MKTSQVPHYRRLQDKYIKAYANMKKHFGMNNSKDFRKWRKWYNIKNKLAGKIQRVNGANNIWGV